MSTDLDLAALAFDSVDAGLIILDADGVVRGWNVWIVRASSIPADQALSKSFWDLIGAEPPKRLRAAVAHALEAGASSALTHTLHPGLLPLHTRIGAKLLHNVAVVPAGEGRCIIQVTDVTAATEREQVLRERQNARYNAVVNSAIDAIVTIDTAGEIQWINRAAEAEFGHAFADVIGQPISLLLGDTGRLDEVLSAIDRAVDQGRPAEFAGRRLDGSSLDIEFSASRWEGQGRKYVTAILRDITDRKASERALLQLNQSLESLVADRTADRDRMWRLSNDMMIIARNDGRIAAVNPATSAILGWTEARLVGADIRDLIAMEDAAAWDAEAAALLSEHLPRLFSLRVRTADLKGRWIEWSAIADKDFIQVVGRDVTSEREAEAALRAAEDALRQSQKMEAIGHLTGGIAHDFNNLLAGVIGGLEIIKRRISAGRYEDLNRFMEASINSAQRAASLTHRLLAFSRQQPLDPKAHDVNEVVRGMEELMRRSLGEQIRLTLKLDSSLGLASTDANQLENAILNLVINARDATPNGGEVVISTRRASQRDRSRLPAETLGDRDYVRVSVTDSGTGMPSDVIAKAFDPFFTTKPIGKGTGLGLSMIYGFAKQSQGHAEIESQLGKGTTVSLYLPETAELPDVSQGVEKKRAPSGSGETVLVVEDDTAVRMLIADVLAELGYSAIEVGDSRGALPVLQSDAQLDLMVTDVGLPGVDGRRLAEIARQHRPGLKVLFVTGYAQHATVRDQFLGANMAMITKPFTLDDLGHKIKAMLE